MLSRDKLDIEIVFPCYALHGPSGVLYGFIHTFSAQQGDHGLGDFFSQNASLTATIGEGKARWPSTHTTFMYWVKQKLLARGYNVIQKRAWKDGHLVDDWLTYIRTRKVTGPYSFFVHDSAYMVRSMLKSDSSTPEFRAVLVMQWAIDTDPSQEVKVG